MYPALPRRRYGLIHEFRDSQAESASLVHAPPTPARIRTWISVAALLARAASAYPGTTEDFPWGERVAKVDQKVFLFQSPDETLEPSVSLKLPYSAHYALSLACSQPTSHGLGKSGWVTVRLDDPTCPDSELLLDWLDESYRARAGRRRIATLDASPVRAAGPD